jgi:benzoyl-CoA reductase/2-hydroxyglutaryl-CoA dehydratase subunit BcrC/BadD/HgdB
MYKTEPLKCWNEVKTITANYYASMVTAKGEGRLLCWAGAGTPSEMLRALDIIPIFGEPFGAVCAAQGVAHDLLEATEASGYSKNLCDYARCWVGAALTGKGLSGKMPEADFVISSKNDCNTHIKWWENVARIVDKPLFVIESPMVPHGLKKHHIEYYKVQLYKLKESLEGHAKRKIDEEQFIQIAVYSRQASEMWTKIMELCKARPSPLDVKTMFSLMVPAINLRGTKEAIDFYTRLYEEVQDRVDRQIAAEADEEYRLIWDNIPLWYNLRMFRQLQEEGAVCITSPYCGQFGSGHKKYAAAEDEVSLYDWSWSEPKNLDQALEMMAETYACAGTGMDPRIKYRIYDDMIKDYQIDGVVVHSNRGCVGLSKAQLDVMRYVQETHDIPVLIFESNAADPEEYSEGQISTRLQAFLELLTF